MFPIIVEESSHEWLDVILSYASKLRETYGDRLVRVVALPSPDQEVYESNVLVVLDRYSSEDMEKVVELALEVNDRINPLVASKDEVDALEAFYWTGGKDIKTD